MIREIRSRREEKDNLIKTPGGFPILNIDPNYVRISGNRSFSIGTSHLDEYGEEKLSLLAQRQYERERELARRGGAGL